MYSIIKPQLQCGHKNGNHLLKFQHKHQQSLSCIQEQKNKSFTKTQLDVCIGFMWQGFFCGGYAEVASVRRHQRLPPCQTESVPASSKIDPPLAKAETISDAGGTSVTTHLRKCEKYCTGSVRETSEENVKQCRSVEKEWEKVLQVPEQRFTMWPMEKNMVKELVPLQPMEGPNNSESRGGTRRLSPS